MKTNLSYQIFRINLVDKQRQQKNTACVYISYYFSCYSMRYTSNLLFLKDSRLIKHQDNSVSKISKLNKKATYDAAR